MPHFLTSKHNVRVYAACIMAKVVLASYKVKFLDYYISVNRSMQKKTANKEQLRHILYSVRNIRAFLDKKRKNIHVRYFSSSLKNSLVKIYSYIISIKY